MSEDNKDNYVMVFEAPVIKPPEFRLYYDDTGNVLFYTCEKPEGKYIVIDKLTFACARHDLKVIDGRIVNTSTSGSVINKLLIEETGIACSKEDVSILIDSDNPEEVVYWKLKTYELQ